MLTRSVLLAFMLVTWAGSQTLDYVPELKERVAGLTAGVRVVAKQSPASSGVTCSYTVTNHTTQSVYMFQVGASSKGTKTLPEPLRGSQPRPGATPAGWFETWGSDSTGHWTGWQARTSKDLIQRGESREFSVTFPLTEGFECGALDSDIKFAAVFPEIKPAPATISISLSNFQIASQGGFEGDVSIQNSGPNDAVLNLGISLGNGARSYPDRLSLLARGPDGQVQAIHLQGPPGIAGRVDPMVAPLPQRGVYTVHCRWQAVPGLTPGKYGFSVEFEGVPARNGNLDMRIMNLMPCWLGKVRSNEIDLDVP